MGRRWDGSYSRAGAGSGTGSRKRDGGRGQKAHDEGESPTDAAFLALRQPVYSVLAMEYLSGSSRSKGWRAAPVAAMVGGLVFTLLAASPAPADENSGQVELGVVGGYHVFAKDL